MLTRHERYQQARRYATEPPSPATKKAGSNAFLYIAGAGVLGGGAGYYFLSGTSTGAAVESKVAAAAAAAAPSKPAFTGGDQGFLSLKLAEVEIVNHNTKRFRFELPEADQVSGLQVASAILTKYKGPNDAKATLRPYTPINDESMWNKESFVGNT